MGGGWALLRGGLEDDERGAPLRRKGGGGSLQGVEIGHSGGVWVAPDVLSLHQGLVLVEVKVKSAFISFRPQTNLHLCITRQSGAH